MKLNARCTLLLALLAPLASACETSQGMPAATPHWTYAKTSADGTRMLANFRADDEGNIVYFTTEVQHANGDHYFGQGTPSPEDVALLKHLTTQTAIDALYPNLVVSDGAPQPLRESIAAHLQVSLWPQGCTWPVSDQCHQILGSVSLAPKNPAVDRLDQFFADFTHRNRGVKASEGSLFMRRRGVPSAQPNLCTKLEQRSLGRCKPPHLRLSE